MAINIAINGFGRIGKTFLRAIINDKTAATKLNVVAINLGPSSAEHLASFFTYDSILGTFEGSVKQENDKLIINGHEISIFSESDPKKLPWTTLKVDWVVEASGKFSSKEKSLLHIDAGSKKVLITAPAKNEDVTIIPGVNDSAYDAEKHQVVSLGSCTTNCFAPMIKVIMENFELTQGAMTTIHAYTNNQALLDSQHKDPRRGRAAASNIIPTSTGAGKVITKIYPELEGKLCTLAIRVPVMCGSLVDFTFHAKQEITAEKLNNAFKTASENSLRGILQYSTDPLVSADIIGMPYSCIIDGMMSAGCKNTGKVFGWYDNEFGYCCRLKDFLLHNC